MNLEINNPAPADKLINMEENTQLPKEVFKRGDYVQPQGETAIVLVTGWTNTEANFRGVVVDTPIDAQFPLRLGEYSETWHTNKFKKIAYATKLHQANETIKVLTYDNNRLKGEVEGLTNAVDELKGENEKLKATATGWRPLLEEVLKLDDLEVAYISEELIEKIKTFLYGE